MMLLFDFMVFFLGVFSSKEDLLQIAEIFFGQLLKL